MEWGCFGSFHHFQGIFFHFLLFENPWEKMIPHHPGIQRGRTQDCWSFCKELLVNFDAKRWIQKKTLSLRFRKVTFCKPYATLCCPRNPWEPSPVPARHKGGGKRRHCPQTVETALKWWVHVCNKSLAIKSLAITYTPKMNLKLESQSEKFCTFFFTATIASPFMLMTWWRPAKITRLTHDHGTLDKPQPYDWNVPYIGNWRLLPSPLEVSHSFNLFGHPDDPPPPTEVSQLFETCHEAQAVAPHGRGESPPCPVRRPTDDAWTSEMEVFDSFPFSLFH